MNQAPLSGSGCIGFGGDVETHKHLRPAGSAARTKLWSTTVSPGSSSSLSNANSVGFAGSTDVSRVK
jgi:hypothetical protein